MDQKTFAPRSVTFACVSMWLLSSVGCTQVHRVAEHFRGNTPGRDARQMEDEASADNRREGMGRLIERDFARKDPYLTRYRQVAENDTDPLVRAMAIRALIVSRDPTASGIYLKALADPDVSIRLEGAKALSRMPNPDATDALLRVLAALEENQDVRVAAAAALRHYARVDVARSLVAVLDERTFGVAWQARRSLQRITGVDYAYEEAAWLEYLSKPAQPLG